MHKSNRGQLSIFLGITLILVMGMLAFVINVGLFVKAKINLQNAVDAAAFSGASTQARQLTNIAYANWELRNTYKEWMFKYYILGQIGLFPTNFTNLAGKNPNIDFTLTVPPLLQFNAATATNSVPSDAYNVPSICIHNNTSKNICPLYMVPGLPQFKAIGVGGITEIHQAIVDKLVQEKGSDCVSRTKINYLAAMSWTYSSGIKETPGAPLIAANRPGAWPQALELALRIRNLEMIVNRPAVTSGMDYNDARQLATEGQNIALNERPYKAFMSAYKNLSGGKYKEQNKDELSGNFKLYEVPPNPSRDAAPLSASGFLIPPTFNYINGGGITALKKTYLDLKVMPMNYALMYSSFTTTSYKYEGVDAAASCGISKTAIPVPGYIIGFTKNPEVITYYAVKGESKFIGLFFPFLNRDGVKLTAYAAAKPFGGRIGPKLFDFSPDDTSIRPREDLKKSRSYFSGLKAPPAGTAFKTGYSIPYDQNFWALGVMNPVLGGIPGASEVASFGIPNLIYELEDEGDLIAQNGVNGVIQDIAYNYPKLSSKEDLGLYNRVQFRHLRNSIGNITAGGIISSSEINAALIRSRRPTKYDAINYLIPDFKKLDSATNNVQPFITPLGANSANSVKYQLFAPLSGPFTLYPNNTEVETVVNSYINTMGKSVETYLKSLKLVADSVLITDSRNADATTAIHINGGTAGSWKPPPLDDANCKNDIASIFNHFFANVSYEACGIVPLRKQMVDFIFKVTKDAGSLYYTADYSIPGTDARDALQKPVDIMTAYFPGKRQGADSSDLGIVNHPLAVSSGGSGYSSRRNFYSTKFVQLAKFIENPPNTQGSTFGISDYKTNPALKEASTAPTVIINAIMNPIKYDPTSGINNNYYLDF